MEHCGRIGRIPSVGGGGIVAQRGQRQVVKGARSLMIHPKRRPDCWCSGRFAAGGQAYRRFHPIERWLHFSTMEGFLRLECGDFWV